MPRRRINPLEFGGQSVIFDPPKEPDYPSMGLYERAVRLQHCFNTISEGRKRLGFQNMFISPEAEDFHDIESHYGKETLYTRILPGARGNELKFMVRARKALREAGDYRSLYRYCGKRVADKVLNDDFERFLHEFYVVKLPENAPTNHDERKKLIDKESRRLQRKRGKYRRSLESQMTAIAEGRGSKAA